MRSEDQIITYYLALGGNTHKLFLLSINNNQHLNYLQFVLLSEFPVLLHEGVDAVNHLLDELHLGVAEPVLVGDVVGNT